MQRQSGGARRRRGDRPPTSVCGPDLPRTVSTSPCCSCDAPGRSVSRSVRSQRGATAVCSPDSNASSILWQTASTMPSSAPWAACAQTPQTPRSSSTTGRRGCLANASPAPARRQSARAKRRG
eukprot:8344619-Pyramimonas_sp.AAC.1